MGVDGAPLRDASSTGKEALMRRRKRGRWKIAGLAVIVGLLASACSREDPLQALIEEACTAAEETRSGKEVNEVLFPRLFEANERAAELGMNEESFSRAVEARCGEALREAAELGRAYEEAREAEHSALLDPLRIDVDECTDKRAMGTVINTSDQAIPDVAVIVLLFDADGIQLTSSVVEVGDLAPGESRSWVAPRSPDSLPEEFEYSVERCEPVAVDDY